MRFLIISKPKFMVPPELVTPLLDAFIAYIDKYKASGKLETEWSFADAQGGGAIVNVDSLEELGSILAEFPLGPFSEVEVSPMADLKEMLQKGKQVAQMMAQQMSG